MFVCHNSVGIMAIKFWILNLWILIIENKQFNYELSFTIILSDLDIYILMCQKITLSMDHLNIKSLTKPILYETFLVNSDLQLLNSYCPWLLEVLICKFLLPIYIYVYRPTLIWFYNTCLLLGLKHFILLFLSKQVISS